MILISVMYIATSVAGLWAEWTNNNFTSLKVVWLDETQQGAVTTYMITYSPARTTHLMNSSSSTERTVTTKTNNIVITELNPDEFYFLHVEVVVSNVNIAQVAIGKCMHTWLQKGNRHTELKPLLAKLQI